LLPAAELAQRMQGRQVATLAISLVGLLALCLACFGIFGIVACGATLRTPEIGIRRARGARSGSIIFLLLRQVLIPVGLGIAVGTIAGVAGSRVLEGEPFYLPGLDVAVPLSALTLFVAIATVAAILPAIRVLRLDPLAALKYEYVLALSRR
jgi:ABC-type antimicrobial peptide transport system permease subunit